MNKTAINYALNIIDNASDTELISVLAKMNLTALVCRYEHSENWSRHFVITTEADCADVCDASNCGCTACDLRDYKTVMSAIDLTARTLAAREYTEDKAYAAKMLTTRLSDELHTQLASAVYNNSDDMSEEAASKLLDVAKQVALRLQDIEDNSEDNYYAKLLLNLIY